MYKKAGALLLVLLVSGCANSLVENQERNVESSLPYDSVACADLLAQRNELSRTYGLPIDAKPVFMKLPADIGPLIPDIRSNNRREAEKARGEIDAMNRSLTRRKCTGALAIVSDQ